MQPIIIEPAKQADASLILLHGLGADASDLRELASKIQALHMRAILPYAPHRPISLYAGEVVPGWYDLFGLDSAAKQDDLGIYKAQKDINQLIQIEIDKGIDHRRIVLGGFSQGGALALFTGLRFPLKLGGILALSTYLPLADSLEKERDQSNRDLPIFLSHGTEDEVILFEYAKTGLTFLKSLGYQIDWKPYHKAHNLIEKEVSDIKQWLNIVIA